MIQNLDLEKKKTKPTHWDRKKIILAEVFCSCDDLRTENVILINWHDQPELLPGRVESGARRKQSSHVAKRLGKEMLAEEGRSPWDRTDDNRNMNVSYFQVTGEAHVTGRLRPNFFACIPDMVSNSRPERQNQAQKSTGKWHESDCKWFCSYPTQRQCWNDPKNIKKHSVEGSKTNSGVLAVVDRGRHNIPKLMQTRDRVGRHQFTHQSARTELGVRISSQTGGESCQS